MAFEVISSTTIRRESNLRVERMEICVDTIEDLPSADSNNQVICGYPVNRHACAAGERDSEV